MLLIMLTLAEIVSFLSLLSSGKVYALGKTECWSKLLGQNYGENARLDPEGKNIVVALFLLIYQSPSGEKAQSFAFFLFFYLLLHSIPPSPKNPLELGESFGTVEHFSPDSWWNGINEWFLPVAPKMRSFLLWASIFTFVLAHLPQSREGLKALLYCLFPESGTTYICRCTI